MVKRRSMVVGLGALATGSGAVFSSAAFSTSSTSDADLRVLVEESLNLRPNPDATDASNIVSSDSFFNGEDIDESEDGAFSGDNPYSNPPLAATNGEQNSDLGIFAVARPGDVTEFNELLILENNTTDPVAIGIAYDRGNSDFNDENGTGQYGDDIGVFDNPGLSPAIPRSSYRFEVNEFTNGDSVGGSDIFGGTSALISPAANGDLDGEASESDSEYVGNSNGIANPQDRPANAIKLEPGDGVTLDLVVDMDYGEATESAIREEANIDLDGFGTQQATVDLLDGITVGTLSTYSP